jgi:DNA-binding transcriptional LysR family regulator
MSDIVSSADLRLVLMVARSGSVGGAARRLRVSQPSASQRLARLERRAGLVLFQRDTRGARPTPAGLELARQAEHILGHLEGALEAASAAGHRDTRRVGTIPSLADRVLPAFDAALPEALVEQTVDHGDRLMDWLDEGTLDAAVLAIAGQLDLPRSVRRYRIGTDELALFLPMGVPAPRARTSLPLAGRDVVFASYDTGADAIRQRLVGLGAQPRRAATVQAALGIARRQRCAAVVPRSLSTTHGRERLVDLGWGHRLVLDLVVPRTPAPGIVRSLPVLRSELGLAHGR